MERLLPNGFNNSDAEFLWRDLASFVSLGCSEQDLKEKLSSIYLNGTLPVEANGSTATLNLSGIKVEKTSDGTVKLKVPIVSSVPLNYTYFNSTNVRVLYEVWNETLVRYYKVEKQTGLYSYVVEDQETGRIFNIVSKLFVETYAGSHIPGESCS